MEAKLEDAAYLFISLDTESTGLNVALDEVTELGFMIGLFDKDCNVLPLLGQFVRRIKVNRAISAGSQRVTNITNEQLEQEESFVAVMEEATQYINETCSKVNRDVVRGLLTHGGIKFDAPLLIHELHRNSIVPNTFLRRWRVTYLIDTLSFCRNPSLLDHTLLMRHKSGEAVFKLGDIHRAVVGTELVGAHGALQDALGVWAILTHCAPLRKAIAEDMKTQKFNYVVNFERFICSVMDHLKTQSKKKPAATYQTIDLFFQRKAPKIDHGSSSSSSSITAPFVTTGASSSSSSEICCRAATEESSSSDSTVSRLDADVGLASSSTSLCLPTSL